MHIVLAPGGRVRVGVRVCMGELRMGWRGVVMMRVGGGWRRRVAIVRRHVETAAIGTAADAAAAATVFVHKVFMMAILLVVTVHR